MSVIPHIEVDNGSPFGFSENATPIFPCENLARALELYAGTVVRDFLDRHNWRNWWAKHLDPDVLELGDS